MDEIAQALSEYNVALANFKWLKDNDQLVADADVGQLAYQSAIYFKPPYVVEAFVAVMEIAKLERERLGTLPKRQRASSSEKAIIEHDARRAREQEVNERGKQLSAELAQIA